MRTARRTAQAVTAAAATKGTSDGPIGVGCRFTQRAKSFGQVGKTVTELIRYERPRHLASMVDSAAMHVEGTSPPTGRLRLRRDGGLGVLRRGAWRLLRPLVGRAGRRLERRAWHMKDYVDSASAEPQHAGAVPWPTLTWS